MRISRRGFLKGSLATLFLAGTGLPVYSSTKASLKIIGECLNMELKSFLKKFSALNKVSSS